MTRPDVRRGDPCRREECDSGPDFPGHFQRGDGHLGYVRYLQIMTGVPTLMVPRGDRDFGN